MPHLQRSRVQRDARRERRWHRKRHRPGSAVPAGPPALGADAFAPSPARAGAIGSPGEGLTRRPGRTRVSAWRARSDIPQRPPGPRPQIPAEVSQSIQVRSTGIASSEPVLPRPAEPAPRSASTIAQYSFWTLLLLELLRETTGRLRSSSPRRDAGNRPVQPMDDPHVGRLGVGRIKVLRGRPARGFFRPAEPRSPG